MTNGLDCEVNYVFLLILFNIFTVPDDYDVSDLCLAQFVYLSNH